MLLQPGERNHGVWQEDDHGSARGDDVGHTADDPGPRADDVGDSGDAAGEMNRSSDGPGGDDGPPPRDGSPSDDGWPADDGSPGEGDDALDEDFEDNLPVELLALSKRPPTASEQDAALWALCFRALSDPTRIRIVALLCANRFSMTAGMVAYLLRIRPSALSYHLKVLREAGFVRTGRHGTSVTCRLLPDGVLTALRAIGHLTPAYFEWGSSSNPRLQRERMWFAETWAHERAEAARRRGRRRKHLYEAM